MKQLDHKKRSERICSQNEGCRHAKSKIRFEPVNNPEEAFWGTGLARKLKTAGIFLLIPFLALSLLMGGCANDQGGKVRIGVSDEGHVQIIGWMFRELAARQGIECQICETGSGTANVQPALENNSLQVGIEFTQSAWVNVLHKKTNYQFDDLGILQKEYQKLNLYWYSLPMVADHYTLAISRKLAEKEKIATLSDLAAISPDLTIGAQTSFFEEADEYPLLSATYGMDFKKCVNLPRDQLTDAVRKGKADVIPGHSLDGRIRRSELLLLEDDLQLHNDTTAGIVITKEALMAHPDLGEIAMEIARVLRGEQLALYAEGVEYGLYTPQDAALQLLKSKGLITEKPTGK